MKKQQKEGTSDLRNKLANDMVSKIEKFCNKEGYRPEKAFINQHVETAIDNYVQDWYEVSLEAMDLMEGGADFTTDEEIDDPELIKEVKRRVVKNMYEERPPGIHEQIAVLIIHAMNSNPQETDLQIEDLDSSLHETDSKTEEGEEKTLEAEYKAKKPGKTKTPVSK